MSAGCCQEQDRRLNVKTNVMDKFKAVTCSGAKCFKFGYNGPAACRRTHAAYKREKDDSMQIINILTQYYPSFFKALGITMQMTVISLLCATVLGVIFGLFKVSDFKALKVIANFYIDIIRGTPLLVQVYIMYYGVGSMLRPLGFQWNLYGGAFTAGCVTLSLNAGAYMAEIIRGGIEAVDKGQMEAARSLGLSYGKARRKVILPQAFRTMLPTIINKFIITLKDTSLISVIGPRELTQNGKIIAANASSMVMPIYLAVAIFYLVVCTILSRMAKYVERRVSYGK